MEQVRLLTVKEYADREGITPAAVYKQIQKGQVNYDRIGKNTYLIKLLNLGE